MTFGPLEFMIIIINILLWLVPIAIVVVLVRNYFIKRHRAENRELQEEIDALKDQVSSLERNRKG
ncbi:multiple C2 domain-containing protein, transmembrane 1 [Dehalogenimonas lykanthroporepellens BL-DC-9]|jgi:cell division protein FtsB|nr:multiple C2 domain-containing protein, transmembrane 1 [Dehalogenimonas lykanthroporepellens BL-DC-9]